MPRPGAAVRGQAVVVPGPPGTSQTATTFPVRGSELKTADRCWSRPTGPPPRHRPAPRHAAGELDPHGLRDRRQVPHPDPPVPARGDQVCDFPSGRTPLRPPRPGWAGLVRLGLDPTPAERPHPAVRAPATPVAAARPSGPAGLYRQDRLGVAGRHRPALPPRDPGPALQDAGRRLLAAGDQLSPSGSNAIRPYRPAGAVQGLGLSAGVFRLCRRAGTRLGSVLGRDRGAPAAGATATAWTGSPGCGPRTAGLGPLERGETSTPRPPRRGRRRRAARSGVKARGQWPARPARGRSIALAGDRRLAAESVEGSCSRARRTAGRGSDVEA